MRIDYTVGDVVVCVSDKPCPYSGPTGLKRGGLYTVEHIGEVRCYGRVHLAVVLVGVKPPNHDAFNAILFRKAFTPDREVEREIVEPIPDRKRVRP